MKSFAIARPGKVLGQGILHLREDDDPRVVQPRDVRRRVTERQRDGKRLEAHRGVEELGTGLERPDREADAEAAFARDRAVLRDVPLKLLDGLATSGPR